MIRCLKQKCGMLPSEVKGLSKGVFWSVVGSVASRCLPFLAWILVAKILGKEQFGQYGLIKNTVLMFASFAGFGLGITGTKFVAEYQETDMEKASRIASLALNFAAITGGLIAIFVFVFSEYIAERVLESAFLSGELKIAAFILLFSAYNGAQNGILNGLKKFKALAQIALLNGIACFPVYVLGAYGGVFWSVVAFAFGNLFLCVQASYHLRQAENNGEISIQYASGWSEWRILATYSMPAALSGVMIVPVKWIADVMLIRECSFASMGVFSAALTFHSILVAFASTISNPFIAYMASAKGDSEMVNRLNLILPWFMGSMMCTPLMCVPEIGVYIFGDSFAGIELYRAMILVALFTAIVMYKQGLARIFVVRNMQWVGFLSNGVWAVALLGSFWCFREGGAYALAACYTFAYIVNTVITYPIYIVKKWVPTVYLFSIESLAIWMTVGASCWLSFSEVTMGWRVLGVGGILMVQIFAFLRLFRSNCKY